MIRLSACVLVAVGSLASQGAFAQASIGVSLRESDGGQTRAPTASGQRPIALEVADAREAAGNGNPLWGIPLSALAVTQERPIFSPSRRRPTPVAEAPRFEPPAAPPVEPAAPERPLFSLVGTVTGGSADVGIFLDETANTILRLHVGEAEAGWVLRSVDLRSTTLEKNRQKVTLALPASSQAPAGAAQSPAPPYIRPREF